jgi:hypothetical protein
VKGRARGPRIPRPRLAARHPFTDAAHNANRCESAADESPCPDGIAGEPKGLGRRSRFERTVNDNNKRAEKRADMANTTNTKVVLGGASGIGLA